MESSLRNSRPLLYGNQRARSFKNRLELTPLYGEIGVQTISLRRIPAILRGAPRVSWGIVQCRKTYLTDWPPNGQVQVSLLPH